MPNPTLLTAPTILSDQVGITTNATMPGSFSAGSNRMVLIHIAMYNGGGNAGLPTAVTCNGVSAVFLTGDSATQTRLSLSTWYFLEADLATIAGQSLVSNGGTGTLKSVAYGVVQDARQSTPTNKNFGYTSAGGTLSVSLTREADSLTYAYSFTNAAATLLTLAEPTRTGSNAFTTRWGSYGTAADTARTANFTMSGGTYMSGNVFNIITIPSQTITDINSGAAVDGDSSGNTFTTTGFTEDITDVDIGGLTCTNVDETAGSGTFDVPPPVDGEVYPELGVNQDVTISGATESAILAKMFELGTYTIMPLVDPNLADPTYPTYHFDFTPVTTDLMITEDGITPSADGGVTLPAAAIKTIMHWVRATGVMYIYSFEINQDGVVTNSIVARHIVASGIVARSIVARGI